MEKRFKKIRWNGSEVGLEWTSQDGSETHNHELTCKDEPRDEFDEALQSLRGDVLVIAELPREYGKDMRVQSVSLSMNAKSGARGAVVTAMKTLAKANSPLALHTPHLLAEIPGELPLDGEPTGVMPTGMWGRIEKLEQEAWAYLAGKRAPVDETDSPAEERELASV
jgi:hypothetical protein